MAAKTRLWRPLVAATFVIVLVASVVFAGLPIAQATYIPAGDVAAGTAITGWLTVLWPDGQAGSSGTGQPLYILTDESGQRTIVRLDEKTLRPLGGILAVDRQRVKISGSPLNAAPEQAGTRVIQAAAVELVTTAATNQSRQLAVTGSQRWISIMCKFADVAAQPRNLSYFQGMLDSTYPHLDDYWRQASYGAANIAGSGAVGWYLLPNPRSYYVTANGLDYQRAANDCTAKADPYVNFANYVGINLMFNDELDGFAWGGGWFMTLDGISRIWYMTWEPPWGYENIGVIAHEMGHGFGLPHSSGNYGQVYDDAWDVMSDIWDYCSLLTDPVYGCVGQGTISYHKDLLGWIPSSQRYVANGSAATITIERLALPQSSAYLMAVIPIVGSSTHFYTVEVRRKAGYDLRLPLNGVVIHEVDTTRTEPAHVIDADLNGNTGDEGAIWRVGETFSAPANHVSVAVNSMAGTAFVVTINGSGPTPTVTSTATPTRTAPPTRTATPTCTATPTPQAQATPYAQRINAGGPTYVDSQGQKWRADRAFVSGSFGYVGGVTKTTTAQTMNSDDDFLFQSARQWQPSERALYKFAVPNGQYMVTLRFAEMQWTQAGQRIFGVQIENTPVLTGFDVFQATGGRYLAIDKTFTVTVRDGVLNIAFVSQVGKPLVNAIAVQQILPP